VSIPLSTDIIAGVASAADPVKAQAAAGRLARFAGSGASSLAANEVFSSVSGAVSAALAGKSADTNKTPIPFVGAMSRASMSQAGAPPMTPLPTASTPASSSCSAVTTPGGKVGSVIGQIPSALSPAQKFEAFVLQNFIELMLPKNADGVYGSGVAGDNWKSLLAEKMASQISQSGRVGVASYLDPAKRAAAAASPQISQPIAAAPSLASYLSVLPSSRDRS
jgi:peptidoglycan hydrolase FlgJ